MLKKFLIVFLSSTVTTAALSNTAFALPEFKKAFDEKYVKTSKNAQFKADFKKAACYTCHVKGKKKSEHNAYGKVLAKLIEGDAYDRKKAATKESPEKGKAMKATILKELEAAFIKVEKLKSKSGTTIGQVLKEGKLPAPFTVSTDADKDGEKGEDSAEKEKDSEEKK